jgi:hypothetical protein
MLPIFLSSHERADCLDQRKRKKIMNFRLQLFGRPRLSQDFIYKAMMHETLASRSGNSQN